MRHYLRMLSILLSSLLAADLPAFGDDAKPRYRIAYATYLGGKEWDQAREVIVFRSGAVLIGGQTCSSDMPVTPGVIGMSLEQVCPPTRTAPLRKTMTSRAWSHSLPPR